MSALLEQPVKPTVKKPSQFQVLLLNDDYTTMEFVIEVLQHIFNKNTDESHQLMMQIHLKGEGVCGVYSFDVAQSKVQQVLDYAQHKQHPLMCILREIITD